MAKPGSRAAQNLAANGRARAVDLARAGLGEDEAVVAQELIEERIGCRCDGCGRRVMIGVRFTAINPRAAQPVLTLTACAREDCDFAEQAREGATFMEPVEYAWLDANGKDARPSPAIVARAERRRAALEQR